MSAARGRTRHSLTPARGGEGTSSRLTPHASPAQARDSSLLTPHSSRAPAPGFTLIELIIVMAILALLISIAVPRYFAHIERAKEATLKQDLNVMRDAIDKFYGDQGRFPDSLDELVARRYLRSLPQDPVAGGTRGWVLVAPEAPFKGQVSDLRSCSGSAAMVGVIAA